jgi:hypothetical protein
MADSEEKPARARWSAGKSILRVWVSLEFELECAVTFPPRAEKSWMLVTSLEAEEKWNYMGKI